MNKKGFIATSLIFAFFILFVGIMTSLLINYAHSRVLVRKANEEIVDDLSTVIFSGNEVVDICPSTSECEKTFAYTGAAQSYTIPASGYYYIELYGAQGGSYGKSGGTGVKTTGYIYMKKNEILYFYVGGQSTTNSGGWNGGGDAATNYNARGGGGATDVRVSDGAWNDVTSLKSRIMVAAGGGGSDYYANQGSNGGAGGIIVGYSGAIYRSGGSYALSVSTGGKEISGGGGGVGACTGGAGGFGTGGKANCSHGGGGGGGWYGGGSGCYNSSVVGSGAGGSSYISGFAGMNSINIDAAPGATNFHLNTTKHYSGKYFIKIVATVGAKTGNGAAFIKYMGIKPISNSTLKDVQYIKDCATNNSKNNNTHWLEMQAIVDGENILKGLSPTNTTNYPAFNTDGIITNHTGGTGYTYLGAGEQCVIYNLGKTYNLDELAVWHYYDDDRTYYNNYTSISKDGTIYTKVINVQQPATSYGKRISSY